MPRILRLVLLLPALAALLLAAGKLRAQVQPDEAGPARQRAPDAERGFAAGPDLERAGGLGGRVSSGPPARSDIPSPDAMWLGQRIVPRALVQGFRGGVSADVLDRVLGARISAAEQPPIRARALRAMEPILDEAFPPELLAGIAAQFLARNYTADELVALRAREESAIGRKLREFDRSAAAGPARSGAASDEAREALALRMFTDAERREIEAFAATPLGHKGLALAPDLVGFFVGELERRYASVRAHIEPRLADVVEAALATLTPPAP